MQETFFHRGTLCSWEVVLFSALAATFEGVSLDLIQQYRTGPAHLDTLVEFGDKLSPFAEEGTSSCNVTTTCRHIASSE